MERFSRAEVYLAYEAMFWSNPHDEKDYAPVVYKHRPKTRLLTADDAEAFFRSFGFG